MRQHKLWQTFALILFLLACVRVASAQQASLTGRITDGKEAVIAGAGVKVTNLDTGITRQVETNSEGYFTAPFLQPGNYRVTVEANGFKTATRDGVKLTLDQVARTDFALEPGEVTQTVNITAEAPGVADRQRHPRHGHHRQAGAGTPLEWAQLHSTCAARARREFGPGERAGDRHTPG